MKYKYFLTIVLFYINCNRVQNNPAGFIAFAHTGMVNRITTPLYISTKKIDIKLNKWQLIDFKHFIGDSTKITKENQEQYISLKFDRVMTDTVTFSCVYKFIFDHKDYFVSSTNKNAGSTWESYNIHVNDLQFSIYYKFKDDFFRDLENYLGKKKCDKNVIVALSHL